MRYQKKEGSECIKNECGEEEQGCFAFSDRLRYLRKKCGYSQTAVAKELGYVYTTVSNYERGTNEPTISNLIRLAEYFDVSLDYLLGRIDCEDSFKAGQSKLPKTAKRQITY